MPRVGYIPPAPTGIRLLRFGPRCSRFLGDLRETPASGLRINRGFGWRENRSPASRSVAPMYQAAKLPRQPAPQQTPAAAWVHLARELRLSGSRCAWDG